MNNMSYYFSYPRTEQIPVCRDVDKSEFSEVLMEINKVELDPKVETFIESEQKKFETSNGITCAGSPGYIRKIK